MKQDDLCFRRREHKAVVLPPLDCQVNGGLCKVDQDIRVFSWLQEHPIISIAFRPNAGNPLETIQKTVKDNIPDQW